MDERARILIVEPDRNYLGVLSRRLADAGFRVTTADSASGAVAELHRLPVDLVLAELNMKPTSGAELAWMIRGEIQWRDLPVMLITGKSKPADAVRAYQAGADDVVLKPFHFEVLVARIESRLARVRAIKSLQADNATLDARVVERAILLGELKNQLAAAEAECRRLETIVHSRRSR
jgi:DNA-binding response OmpR family regulator